MSASNRPRSFSTCAPTSCSALSRFENEAEFIRTNGGHIIHIQRDNAETVREHVSETGVKFISGKDLLINNNGSRNALYDKAAQTLQVIKDEHHKIKAA